MGGESRSCFQRMEFSNSPTSQVKVHKSPELARIVASHLPGREQLSLTAPTMRRTQNVIDGCGSEGVWCRSYHVHHRSAMCMQCVRTFRAHSGRWPNGPDAVRCE